MKIVRAKLMMCAAFVGLMSGAVEAADQAKTVRLRTGRELSIPTPEQSADVRDREYYVHIQKKLHAKINQYSQEAAARLGNRNTEEIFKKIKQENIKAQAFLEQNGKDHLLYELKHLKDALLSFEKTVLASENPEEHEATLNEIEFIKSTLLLIKNPNLLEEVLINIYRLINAYVGIPGSIVNQISMGGDQPFDKAAYLNHRVAATERRTAKYEAGTPLNCPDAHVLGRTVRELFPYFTQRSFNAGMAVTNVVTGEKPPMTTVKLNGRWWKVYAMDKKTQQEHEAFTPIPGGNSYWPTSIRQVVAPYAFRFDQSASMTNSLLGDNGQGYYDPTLMRNIQPKQSVVAKKMHRAITSSDNGIFWQRDTAFDDGQSNFCTYTSSSYMGAPRQGMHHYYGNFERTDCTFIFEAAADPTAEEFNARKNGFMKRVYADRQSYYMRHQNLGHYYIDPQDDPVVAQAKAMAEFKERIARDRIYQMQDPAQRRADGRIYSVTPSRIYKSTRNMRDALPTESIDALNSYEFNNRVYLYNRQAPHGMGDSTEPLANERFSVMSANVSQAATSAAQRRAENALGKSASTSAPESKGDER